MIQKTTPPPPLQNAPYRTVEVLPVASLSPTSLPSLDQHLDPPSLNKSD